MDEANSLAELVMRARSAIWKKCMLSLAKDVGITASHAAILLAMDRDVRTTCGQLSRQLGIDAAGMSRALDRLEAMGLIVRSRSETDRRTILLALTDDGCKASDAARPIVADVMQQVVRGLKADEVRHLDSLLRRILANADQLDVTLAKQLNYP